MINLLERTKNSLEFIMKSLAKQDFQAAVETLDGLTKKVVF